MRIQYDDEDLRRLAEDPDFKPRKWGRDRLEQLTGDRAGTSSIRLNNQFRLILTFHTEKGGRVVVVLELVDYH